MVPALIVITTILIISIIIGAVLEYSMRKITLTREQKELSDQYKKMLKRADARRRRRTK